ncbi:MAG: formylglycine-generating enzyme family protein [Saprospiraceae bacterium]|nr:formylglycine-generating enzyme family protein [Candidatus Vicinibacter affinis]
MKNKMSTLLCPFVIIGVLLILLAGCNKEDNNNPEPVNIATVQIPAGTFTMQASFIQVLRQVNETQYQVTLSAFLMSKCEITNAEYAAFLNSKSIDSTGLYSAGQYPGEVLIYASSGSFDWGLHCINGQWRTVAGYENHPVINVTWYGAVEFATYAGGTLPTEAQWEYACRGNTTTPFYTGDCLSTSHANFDWSYPYDMCIDTISAYPNKTTAVGSYASNAYGLHDMHGNVREWCSDLYDLYPTTAQTNPTGGIYGIERVTRGGSWYNYPWICRSAHRHSNEPFAYGTLIGFRIVFLP